MKMTMTMARMSAPPAHFVAAEHLAVAKHIMLTDFSESVETISSFLLSNGPTSLKDLVLMTSLPAPLVRNGLLALMQQNIVTCPVLPEVDTSAAAKARRAAGWNVGTMWPASRIVTNEKSSFGAFGTE